MGGWGGKLTQISEIAEKNLPRDHREENGMREAQYWEKNHMCFGGNVIRTYLGLLNHRNTFWWQPLDIQEAFGSILVVFVKPFIFNIRKLCSAKKRLLGHQVKASKIPEKF